MKRTAIKIIETLVNKGYETYFAGGYVRDMLMGRDSFDIDIATSATPSEIEKLFPDTIPVGKNFGVMIVVIDSKNYEIATFRKESGYSDKRRPTKVSFTDAKTDALRRDFTINAIFFDPIKNRVIDFTGGADDIKKRTIRFIGNPTDRIQEDPLRLIRAIRLKSTLNFQYDNETFKAIRENSNQIKNVSPERIRDELNKILLSSRRYTALIELSESNLLSYIIPEIENLKGVPQPVEFHQEGDVFTHTYLALKALPDDSDLRLCWATLLHDIGKPPTLIREGDRIIFHDHAQKSAEMTRIIFDRLKFSKIDKDAVVFLVENHMKVAQLSKMRPGKKQLLLTNPLVDDLVELVEADKRASIPYEADFVNNLKDEVLNARKIKSKVGNRKDKIINGDVLIKMGFRQGPEIKDILEDVSDKIAQSVISNQTEAISYIKSKYHENK